MLTRTDSRSEIARQLIIGAMMLMTVIVIGSIGYRALGDGTWSWFDCFYMTVITLSTVGFAETLPGIDHVAGARVWTLFLILMGSGTLLFFVSSFTAFIVEGDIQGAIRRRRMQKQIDLLDKHFIVVGCGATGIHVVEEMLESRVAFVVIDTDLERLERLVGELGPRMLYVHGDATEDGVLQAAGVGRAVGLAATLKEDKDNVFVSITARALNPTMRIAAKLTEASAETKLKRAGADTTVSPSYIGGARLASELVRPSALQFLDGMASQDLRVEQLRVPDGSSLVGAKLRETNLRQQGRVLVLAVAERDGTYVYSPEPDFAIEQGQTLVVLCRSGDLPLLQAGIENGTIGRR